MGEGKKDFAMDSFSPRPRPAKHSMEEVAATER